MLLLAGCDADKQPPPAPKVAVEAKAHAAAVANTNSAPETKAASVAAAKVPEVPAARASVEPEKNSAPVHAMAPNVSVVPVVAASKPAEPSKASSGAAAKIAAGNARSAKIREDNAEVAHRPTVASKSKPPAQVFKETRLPKASLDLSLPPEMVKQMTPPSKVITAAHRSKTLLPKMFPDSQSDPDFQLNGRLLSNEMQLQLRNESRREVEGAAVDFTFKQ
ncbi:translation initiation factor 2 [Pseudomonas huanghezhanensis]|uniref:translation initiation factor 2 n=1 Tax=Pseudomonas huanghezhanensis TaxID=3002903 RepID=UPI002285E053|nr:translation initiation factor 2 [Pseudomonas sp. BSw22131]